jgi:hypothetical protein
MTLRTRTARLATLAVAATALAAGTAVAGHAGQASATDASTGPAASPATAIPAPAFVGTWNNIASTGHFVKLSFDVVGGQLRVHAYGACSPTPCDWGIQNAVVYGANVSDANGNTFTAQYDFGFERVIITGKVTRRALKTQTYTQFTDGSGRSNYTTIESFAR